ncbi:MAG: DUF5082 domain-containing protein [Lachnospiraceae bacterium]|nr:DUF5082 domain-containing protein [Lachnospiraceae bacterium]
MADQRGIGKGMAGGVSRVSTSAGIKRTNSAEISSARTQINNKKNEIGVIQNDTASIQSKVDALKRLRDRIEAIRDEIGSQQDSLDDKHMEPVNWRGDNCLGYQSEITELETEFDQIYDQIDDRLDEVRDEVTRLENKINSNDEYLGWLYSSLNSLENWFTKLIN